MPTDFETQMQTDMADVFTNTDDFGELVTWRTAAGTSTAGLAVVGQEYLGAIDEKTQKVFILQSADAEDIDRGDAIIDANGNGNEWTVIDVSQRDAAAVNVRCVLPQERS